MAKRKIELRIDHPSGYSERVKLTIPIAETLIHELLKSWYVVFVREGNEWLPIVDNTTSYNVFTTDNGKIIL